MTIDPHDQIANKMAGYRAAHGFHEDVRLVPGAGPVPPKAVILGGNPDGASVSAGLPFYGMAGQMLTGFMDRAGLWRDDCYLTYGLKFQPGTGGVPAAGLAAEWRAASWPFLRKELKVIGKACEHDMVSLPVMMVMGTGPALMLWGPNAVHMVSGTTGKVFIGKQEWRTVLTLDISAAVTSGYVKDEMRSNFEVLARLANGSAA
jgi:uracil-DNA glycosylase family 4